MNARQVIFDAASQFNSSAQAILARCEQSGVILRMDDGHLKAKGNRETISAWQPMIQRHKPEIIAVLTGQDAVEDDARELAALGADYQELTACIIELCRLTGYSDEARERMLAARQNLPPYLYATEAAYFRLQVIRAKAGTYWDAVYPSQKPGNTQASPDTREARTAHPDRRAA